MKDEEYGRNMKNTMPRTATDEKMSKAYYREEATGEEIRALMAKRKAEREAAAKEEQGKKDKDK